MIVTRGLGKPAGVLVSAGLGRSVGFRHMRIRRGSCMTRAVRLESRL